MSIEKLNNDVRKFLEVYNILSPEAKGLVEIQLTPHLQNADKRTKALYSALLSAAQEGLSIADAISRMEAAAKKESS